jgi:hypothetical protein
VKPGQKLRKKSINPHFFIKLPAPLSSFHPSGFYNIFKDAGTLAQIAYFTPYSGVFSCKLL